MECYNKEFISIAVCSQCLLYKEIPFQFNELKKASGEEAKRPWKPKQAHLHTEIYPWMCLVSFLKLFSDGLCKVSPSTFVTHLHRALYEIRPLNCDRHGCSLNYIFAQDLSVYCHARIKTGLRNIQWKPKCSCTEQQYALNSWFVTCPENFQDKWSIHAVLYHVLLRF